MEACCPTYRTCLSNEEAWIHIVQVTSAYRGQEQNLSFHKMKYIIQKFLFSCTLFYNSNSSSGAA